MMTEDKNDYYMIASTHNKMYDIPVYIHKELSNGNHSLPVNLSFNWWYDFISCFTHNFHWFNCRDLFQWSRPDASQFWHLINNKKYSSQ